MEKCPHLTRFIVIKLKKHIIHIALIKNLSQSLFLIQLTLTFSKKKTCSLLLNVIKNVSNKKEFPARRYNTQECV